MTDIWVISDTHFGHDNIIEYCNRPFKDGMTMAYAIRDNWNALVKPQDKVYHLGDVYMGWRSGQAPEDFLRTLNGHKRLILGNHDNGKDQNLLHSFEKIDLWRVFKEFGLLLTHVPVHPDNVRFGDGSVDYVNVHGHIHANPSPKGPYINACVEWHNYRPVNIEELRIK